MVEGYKAIENTATGAFKKVEDGFVGKFLTHEGETAEDAEKRLVAEQAEREITAKEAAEKCAAETQTEIHNGTDIGGESLRKSLETAKESIETSINVSGSIKIVM